ncbi:MAG: hypothetical protein WBP42_02460 [Candidatus Zixiibacteriota bacterium]
MKSDSSTDKSLDAITHRLRGELGRDLTWQEMQEVLKKSLDCLTPSERELVAMKTTIGLNDSKIMQRFGFSGRQSMAAAFTGVSALLRLYCIYFATVNNARAMLAIKLDLGGDLEHWLRVFKGERQVSNPLRYPYETVEDPDARAFIKTTIEISKFRRL